MCKLWLCVVSLFGLIVAVKGGCELRDTGCQTNNNDYANDTEVHPKAVLNCSFEGSLCCYRQGCVDDGMEQWEANNSYASVRQQSRGCGGNSYSILESPWVNFSTPSCVEFTYQRGTPYQLRVFLAFNNGTLPSSKYDSESAGRNKNRTSRFDVKYLTGKIQFRAQGGGAPQHTALPKLSYVRILDGPCADLGTSGPRHTPSTLANDGQSTKSNCTQASVTTISSTTRYPTTSDRTCPMSTDGDIPSPDGESDNSAAAIAGVVATVVVLIVVIIVVVIVCRRKRRQSKPDDENRNTEDLSMTTGCTNTGNTATERQGNPFSRRDGDYTDIDLATTPSSDINPYELAEDATNTNGSLGPNLQRLNGSKEDDNSRIDEAQPAAAHSEKITTPERPNPKDVYSVVNKPGKKTPTPEYSLAKIVGDTPALPNPNDVYSVVNKKGKKFEPAAKPEQPDTEYNTISHNGNNTSSQKAPGGAPPDTYNRISAVPSLGLNEKGRATTNPEDGLLTDDYNLAANGSVKEKNGAAGAAYDHVRNDPDDAYSKARIGKRNVVIDSDYHHLKP